VVPGGSTACLLLRISKLRTDGLGVAGTLTAVCVIIEWFNEAAMTSEQQNLRNAIARSDRLDSLRDNLDS
jgi:hypothetical protein